MAAVLTDINFLDHVCIPLHSYDPVLIDGDCRAPMSSFKKLSPCSPWSIRTLLPRTGTTMDRKAPSRIRLSPFTSKDSKCVLLPHFAFLLTIAALRQAIEALHGASSKQFKTAAALLQQTLTATLDSILKQSPESTVILLSLPTTYSPPVFRKRSAWLRPFYDAHHDLTRRTAAPAVLQKRSSANFDPVLESANRAAAPKRTAIPIVPSSFTCFESLDKLNNATNSCNDGNGVGVKGVSALMGKNREDCWVCNCGSTVTKGKKTNWKGQGCEKIDLSSFVPLSSVPLSMD